MQKSIILAALLTTIAGCPQRQGPTHPSAKPAHHVKLTLPKTVGVKSYRSWRQVMSSLPLSHPQRPALRAALRKHLVTAAHDALRRKRGDEAMKHFFAAAKLHDPSEVFVGSPKDEELRKLGQNLFQRFSRRGDTAKVLPSLTILISLSPAQESTRLKGVFWRVVAWQNKTLVAMHGKAIKGHRVIPAVEAAAAAWPSEFILGALYKLYLEQKLALQNLGPLRRVMGRRMPFFFPVVRRVGYNITRAYLHVDRPYLALKKIRELEDNNRNAALRGLLERAVAPSASADDHLRLAEEFEEKHPDVALRVCLRAAERFAKHARTHACVGRLGSRTKNTLLAVHAYEQAMKLRPGDRKLAALLAKEYERRIFMSVDLEQLDRARGYLVELAKFHRRIAKQTGRALKSSLGRVYYAVGYGLYNAGKIAEATTALEISVRKGPLPQALHQLGLIKIKAREGKAALAILLAAEKLRMRSPAERMYWQGKFDLALAKAFAIEGKDKLSAKRYRQAARTWRHWSSLGLKPAHRAEAHVQRARALFALGKRAVGMEALEAAIDAAPGRKQTYPEAISLLTLHGHLPEALDAYHRAVGRREISEYLKTYCSLWVISLARRAGRPPTPVALSYLAGLEGTRWYHRLASMALGKTRYETLKRQAANKAKLAELNYYHAEQLLAEGKLEAARKLWQEVVDSKMMAFFEYDMALHNLERGPAKVQTQPVDRRSVSKP